eukprot:NODE_2696_length_880_cov_73.658243_g2223_i0.p1 GENE.NODE_2696_length_880_cov_73.658243_g2223_i0~~NODE_2696_length_880_cov_73.658243_g2223_i0.p1  ORF type:complete len:223 (-),score=51.44 NODE_2696_length_880_cov_73.658243_g2223_i0:39-707(-)
MNKSKKTGYQQPRHKIAFYTRYFQFSAVPFENPVEDNPTFHVHKIGKHLSLLALDTGMIASIPSQSDWLHLALKESTAEGRMVIPVYHQPAYPSVRDFEAPRSREIRHRWVPIFEEFNVTLVLEHHDHYYKRTLPLRKGAQDKSRGVVYLGDGGWGSFTGRKLRGPNSWYVYRHHASNHLLNLRFNNASCVMVVARNTQGEVLDEFAVWATKERKVPNDGPS